MGGAAAPAAIGVGAGANLAGSALSGKGAGQRPAVQIDPAAQQALRTGVAATEASLGALPGTDVSGVVGAFEESGQRLGALGVPQTAIDPQQAVADIAAATQTARAPAQAAQQRAITEQAGAFGPTSAINQAAAGQQAQEENLFQQLIAGLLPQLQSQRFSEMQQSLASAIGLEQARQGAALTPQQFVEGVRGQRLGGGLAQFGGPAAYVPLQTTVPAGGAFLQGAGAGLTDAGTILALGKKNKQPVG